MSKYKAKKTVVDGIVFDSLKEASYYRDLKLLEKAGEIYALELQPIFQIVVNGKKICKYYADFAYMENGERKVVDVKSAFTRKNPVYRIKKKLVEAIYGTEITEV